MKFLVVLLIPFLLLSKQKICLNMIVKNEKDVIERCLESVKDVIDYWVIVDTGSTDGTQKMIRNFMKKIPGELYRRPWKNFEWNRNEALDFARGHGDYILFMDADDVLEFQGKPHFDELSSDLYMMWRGTSDFSYLKPQLVKSKLPCRWVGVTHEYLGCDTEYSSEILANVKYVSMEGGASHKNPKQKYLANVDLLTDALKEDPNNLRHMFYLAESYRDASEPGKALEWFQKRIAKGGWVEEVYWSKLQVALILKQIGLSNRIVQEALLEAHVYRPHRIEPIYYLSELWNGEENYEKAYQFLKEAMVMPKPDKKDALFNMDWMEKYGVLFQFSICSYYAGHYEESLKCCDDLLKMQELPESWRNQAVANREFPLAKLEEAKETAANL